DEGSPASASGSFDDVDLSDNVSIAASVGTITQDVGHSGQWIWSYTPTDGPTDSQTVTITADDGHGGSATTSFDLIVNNVNPRFDVVFLPPDEVEENDTVAIGGTFTDPGTLDTHEVRVIWGDGHIDVMSLPAGTFTFTAVRQFLQNAPG